MKIQNSLAEQILRQCNYLEEIDDIITLEALADKYNARQVSTSEGTDYVFADGSVLFLSNDGSWYRIYGAA